MYTRVWTADSVRKERFISTTPHKNQTPLCFFHALIETSRNVRYISSTAKQNFWLISLLTYGLAAHIHMKMNSQKPINY